MLIDDLENLEASALGNARLDTLRDVNSPDLRKLMVMVMSPSITFGVKQLPDPIPSQSAILEPEQWWPELLNILEDLAERRLTGNAAKSRIGSFLGLCDKWELKWAQRILKQDLRLNIGAKDVNKVIPKTVELFEVALAEDYKDAKEKDLLGKFVLMPKLDGARTVAYLPRNPKKEVVLYSRTGKIWHNFESIRRALDRWNKVERQYRPDDIWLDGEVVCRVDGKINFQALQENLHRQESNESGLLEYVVFDQLIGKWEQPKTNFHDRLELATGFIKNQLRNVDVVEQEAVQNPTMAQLQEASARFVQAGYEGAMLRRADSPGKLKRSKNLLKIKSFKDAEATIVGVVEGNGKLEGMLGTLECRTAAGVEFEIGTGFNDAERTKLWKMKLVGKHVNYKYFELTNDGVPRFPVFRGLRHVDDIGA